MVWNLTQIAAGLVAVWLTWRLSPWPDGRH